MEYCSATFPESLILQGFETV